MTSYNKMITGFLVAVTFFTAGNSIGQETSPLQRDAYRAIHWKLQDGVPLGGMNVMIKDAKGFLWVGAYHGELARFDGAVFKKFIPEATKPGTINSTDIRSLVTDSLDNIWIGTDKGLSRYDIRSDTFTNFVTAPNPVDETGRVLPFWSTKDFVYAFQSGLGVVRFDIHTLEKKVVVTKKLRNYIHHMYSIIDTASNSVWMLGVDSNAVINLQQLFLDRGTTQTYSWPCIRKNTNHRHSAEGMRYDRRRNSIWINSGDGLLEFTLTDKRFSIAKPLLELASLEDYDRFVGIDIDLEGRIWFASKPWGILIYNPETEKVERPFSDDKLQRETGFGNLHIYCDRDGLVWTSYYQLKGMYELIPYNPPVISYEANRLSANSLSSDTVLTIAPAQNGKTWIGTTDGLNIFDAATEQFQTLREKDLPGIKGRIITPLHIDTIRNKAWLISATSPETYWDGNIFQMDLQTRKCSQIRLNHRTSDLDTCVILPELVIASGNSLFFCDERHGVFEVRKEKLSEDVLIPFRSPIGRLLMVDNRRLFVQTGGVLPNFTFENHHGKWTKISHPLDSINWISLLYNENDKTYWASFKYELVHYDQNFKKLQSYTHEDGYTGIILNMKFDQSGHLWFINLLNQLGRLNTETGIISIVSEAEGFEKSTFDWFSSFVKDHRGIFYISTGMTGSGKLSRLYPERYSSINASSVYLRSLRINQKPFVHSVGINHIEKMSLDYKQNTISIETGVIDYYSRGTSRIRYKLRENGSESDWQYGPSYYTIRYEELPPGNYELLIQASNAGNEFNSKVKTLSFTITPPIWQTWWFRLTALLTLGGLFYWLVRWRMQAKFRLSLERVEKEKQLANLNHKTSELEMQALRAQMNPHFIFNSLNSINSFILQNNRVQASEYLTKFSRLVRLILQNSQASAISLESELESLHLYLELEAVRFNRQFDYSITVAKDLDISIIKVPPMIIQPYAENAIWHGLMHKEDKGHLEIEVIEQDDTLCVKITDDGIGRKKAAELKSKSASNHKSMGMRITADRIAMLQKEKQSSSYIHITDLVLPDGSSGGTEVFIKIPIQYD